MVEPALVPQAVKDAVGPIGPLVIETVGEAGDDIKDVIEDLREDMMDGGDGPFPRLVPHVVEEGEVPEAEDGDEDGARAGRGPARRPAGGLLGGLAGGLGVGAGEDAAGEGMRELGDPFRQYMDKTADDDEEFDEIEEE